MIKKSLLSKQKNCGGEKTKEDNMNKYRGWTTIKFLNIIKKKQHTSEWVIVV